MATQSGREGDDNFVGFASRLDPANLKPTILSWAQNVRLQRGIAQPRKGLTRVTDNTLVSLTMVGYGKYVNPTGREGIVLLFTDKMYIYYPEQGGTAASLSSAYNYPSGRTIASGGEFDVVQANDKLYIFRGAITDNQVTFSNINKPAGNAIVTVDTSSAHGLAVNDEIIVYATSLHPLPHNSLLGSFIVASTPTSTQFTYNCGDTGGALTHTDGNVVKAKPPFVWDGSTSPLTVINEKVLEGVPANMPPGNFGLYFQSRVIVGGSRPVAIAGVDRWARDCVSVSDILDYETFDQTLNQFIINQGGNDSIVGVLPWVQSQFVVFMKKSIWLVYIEPAYTAGAAPGANSTATLISSEIGCLARRSIISAGQFILFLSHKGVHMLTPQLDLQLLGNTMPLSEPIDDIIQRINFNYAYKAVSEYGDNRFYIAIPIDGATRNNAVIVYNTLNQNWESIDTYPEELYIDGLASVLYQEDRKVFMLTNYTSTTTSGGVHVTESNEAGDEWQPSTGNTQVPFTLPVTFAISTAVITTPIDAWIKTREYTLGSMDEKYFTRACTQFNCTEADEVTVTGITHDPDSTEELTDYVFTSSEDGTLRSRVASRGAAMQVQVNFNSGRPSLKSVSVDANIADRSMVSAE